MIRRVYICLACPYTDGDADRAQAHEDIEDHAVETVTLRRRVRLRSAGGSEVLWSSDWTLIAGSERSWPLSEFRSEI